MHEAGRRQEARRQRIDARGVPADRQGGVGLPAGRWRTSPATRSSSEQRPSTGSRSSSSAAGQVTRDERVVAGTGAEVLNPSPGRRTDAVSPRPSG